MKTVCFKIFFIPSGTLFFINLKSVLKYKIFKNKIDKIIIIINMIIFSYIKNQLYDLIK